MVATFPEMDDSQHNFHPTKKTIQDRSASQIKIAKEDILDRAASLVKVVKEDIQV